MLTVTKRFGFEACHMLPNYKGACHNLHGHSYKLDVTVAGKVNKDETSPSYGMIIDFKELKSIVNKEVVDKYDHSFLNDFFKNPTAEIMVDTIARILSKELSLKGLRLQSVKLWETETSYAEWIADPLFSLF